MGSIGTAIELQDNFTGVLYQVISSVNLGLAAMEDLHRTMSAPVDMSSIEGARESVNQAALAVRELDAAFQGMGSPAPGPPAAPAPQGVEPPPAVEVPFQWQTGGPEVFTGSGMERFRQEMQSANAMLLQLSNSQNLIAKQAYNTEFFPPEAFQDVNRMAGRIDWVRERIRQIENNPLNIGTDTVNAGLEQLRGHLGQALREQENLNRALDDLDAQAANEAYLRLQQTIGNTERYIRDNVDEQGRFNREIGQGTDEADKLMQAIRGAVAAYATIQTFTSALNLSDQLVSTTARLDMMNDGLQTTQELQDMIFLSAERARGSYQATAGAVSKLGLMAGGAFSGSAEIIAFMEQINKQFRIAGTETAGIDAAMLQLTQAMGSGVLRGEEYNSILEQAPNIIQNIARYIEGNGDVLAGVAAAMGMEAEELAGDVQGHLKDIAGEGLISAGMVKAAMFAAADETNAKFESMPKTFEQMWTSFGNNALMAFQPVLERMNEIGNSQAFQEFVNNSIGAISALAGVSLELVGLLTGAAGLLADNWSWLSPVIYGVAGALAVYYGWQLAVNAINAAGNAIHVAIAAAQMLHAAATGSLTAATAAEIAAQNGLNASMYACPVMWLIILVIALTAVFYAAVAAVNKFAGTSISATGIICGAFMVGAAFIGNLFVALVNFAIDTFVALWNFIAAFANFFGNVFNDPVGAIARLFFDLADTVLGILESLASAIDTVFGSNLAGAVSGWRDSLGSWVDRTFGQGEEIMAKVNAQDYHLDRFEYKGAWDAGYSFGKGIDERFADFNLSSLFDSNIPDAGDYADLSNYTPELGDIGSGVNDIAGNTGKMADSMDITGEELKYLRDIAEQEAVNRFTTAEIHIEQTNHNTVKRGMDLDGVVSNLTDAMLEAIESTAEGVHD